MFFAINETNERIYIDEAIKNKKVKYKCPICKQELIIKNGNINISHFAHKSLELCDSFSIDMSQWHKDWQNLFPKKNQEVILDLDIGENEYKQASWNYNFSNKELWQHMDWYENWVLDQCPKGNKINLKHRADVLACGYVIEFQHSSISSKEFNERNWFYNRCGYKVIWIFDLRNKYNNEQIIPLEEFSNDKCCGCKYKWNNPIKTFVNFIPQHHKPQYVDNEWWNGDVVLFFQFDDNIIEKVTWAIDEYDSETANFKRFFTSYYPNNYTEFYNCIKNKEL